MLYFPIDIDKGAQDGTDDLMVVYERLALRDATFTKPSRKSEYLSMSGVDMIRNLLLGSFVDSDDSIGFYKQYWLPIEQLADTASHSTRRKFEEVMQDIFEAFLASKEYGEDLCPGFVGGKIYAEFQSWFQRELELSSCVEDAARNIGKLILEFAICMDRD